MTRSDGHMRRATALAGLLALALAWGCDDGPDPAPDADDRAPVDAESVADRGPADAMPPDAIPPDAIPPDAIPPDAIPPDALPPDAMPPDAMPPDAIPPDAIPPDAGPCGDDPTLGAPCTVGQGGCAAEGVVACVDGAPACDAQPGEPSPEVCDAIDDDCDGVVDEDIAVGEPCAVGEGTCRAEGLTACLDGALRCDAEPGEPAPQDDCDGLDNDCNGVVDDLVAAQVPCGLAVGACRRAGVLFCNEAGQRRCDAVPGEPSPEICDGIDNDCDNEADEDTDFAADPLHCGACDVACPGACPRCEVARCVPCRTSADCGSSAFCGPADGACAALGQVYLKDPGSAPFGDFGRALDSDGGRLAIGQPGDRGDGQSALEARNRNLPGAGAVHMLERRGGDWVRQYLKSDQPTEEELFGLTVALRGDVLAVGAPSWRPPASRSQEGRVHIFEARAGAWVHAGRLERVLDAHHRLGESLAVSDGRVFIGDPGDGGDRQATFEAPNHNAVGSGAVFVVERQPDGAWSPAVMLKPGNTAALDAFGTSIAFDGRWLVVGAPGEDGDGSSTAEAPNDDARDAGAVYVFERAPGGAWAQRAYIKAADTAAFQAFGGVVAVSGDRLAASHPGAVYIFDRTEDGLWTQSARIEHPRQPGFPFVGALALRGDRLVVGSSSDGSAPGCAYDRLAMDSAGAAYVFDRGPDGRWVDVALLKAGNAGPLDRLGGAVALGEGRIVVGAAYEAGDGASTLEAPNDAMERAGAVYLFEGLPAPHCGPGAAGGDELCDGADNDCDGEIDEGPDGGALVEACFAGRLDAVDVGICVAGQRVCVAGQWSPCEGQRLPEEEVCDVFDNDCDRRRNEGCVVLDRDGDGVSPFQGDCDDTDPAVLPGADDGCDGIDNDCDAVVDEGGPPPGCPLFDSDGDGVTPAAGDCDDTDPGRFPGNAEVCDRSDDDCDDRVDEFACPEVCDDGVDDDGDRFLDCHDPDCVDDPRCQPGAPCDAELPCPTARVCEDGACVAPGTCARPLPLGDAPAEGSTIGASAVHAEASCAFRDQLADGPELVFRLRVDAAGEVCVSTARSRYDSVVYIRTTCDDPATEVACSEDARLLPNGTAGAATLAAEPAVDYFVFVDGYNPLTMGQFVLEVLPGPCGP